MSSASNRAEQAALLAQQNEKLSAALTRARDELKKMDERLEALASPPSPYAIFVQPGPNRTADVLLSGRHMNVTVDRGAGALQPGQLLRMSEQLIVLEGVGFPATGEVVTAKLRIGDDRLLVSANQVDQVIRVAEPLKPVGVQPGDLLRADLSYGFAYELVERPDVEELLLEEIPDVSYSDIGGLRPRRRSIKDITGWPFQPPRGHRATPR